MLVSFKEQTVTMFNFIAIACNSSILRQALNLKMCCSPGSSDDSQLLYCVCRGSSVIHRATAFGAGFVVVRRSLSGLGREQEELSQGQFLISSV